jgi:hypothetical protein
MDSRLAERVELIEQDDRHGASWLAREAVEAVCEAVQMGEDPVALAQRIVRARPAMGAIAGALGRVLVSGRSDEQIIEEARAVIEGRERASKAIAVLLSPHIQGTVMTHSNSATVREAVEHRVRTNGLHGLEPGEEGCSSWRPSAATSSPSISSTTPTQSTRSAPSTSSCSERTRSSATARS